MSRVRTMQPVFSFAHKVLAYALPLFAAAMFFGIGLQHVFLGLVLVLVLCSDSWLAQARAIRAQPLFWPFLIYGLVMTLGLWVMPVHLLHSGLYSGWPVAMYWKQASLLLALCLMPFFRDARMRSRCIDAFIFAAVCLVFVVCVYRLGWFGLSLPAHRSQYVFTHQIFAAMFVAFAAFLSLLRMHQHQASAAASAWSRFYFSVSPQWMAFQRKALGAIGCSGRGATLAQAWYGLAFFVTTLSLLFQNPSRTGFLLYAVLMVFYGLGWYGRHLKKHRVVASLVLGVVLGGMMTLPHVRGHFSRLWQDVHVLQAGDARTFYQETSLGIRVRANLESFYFWQQRPVIGYGTGAYRILHAQHDGQLPGAQRDKRHTENTFWTLAVEHGVLGVFSWLLLCLYAYRLAADYARADRLMARGFIGMLLLCSWSQDLIIADIPRMFQLMFMAVFFSVRSPEPSCAVAPRSASKKGVM